MKGNVIETVIGAAVLLIATLFFVFAYNKSGSNTEKTYTYQASFDRVDGIIVGSDVRMSGVKVGTITNLKIEPETYLAVVQFTLKQDIRLPKDSSAEIISDGLLGGKYLAVVPGGDESYLQEGSTIIHTQSSVNLEALIGQLIFSKKSDNKKPEVE